MLLSSPRCGAYRCSGLALALAALPVVQGAARKGFRALSAVPAVDGESPYEFQLLEEPPSQRSVAYASFADELYSTGWGHLDIQTNAGYSDIRQAYAAGYLEGYLTAHHIFNSQANMYAILFGPNVTGVSDVPSEVLEFMARQEAWSRERVAEHALSDPFWAHVGNVLAQFDGLRAGYDVAAKQGTAPPLDRFSFLMLSSAGDLADIIPAAKKEMRVDWLNLAQEEAERRHIRSGHCSALVKVTGNFSDLLMSHSTFMDFSNTNRIFKHYRFNFTNPATASRRESFSSYPGILASQDDFYMMESGLGMVQTSNQVVNHSIYDLVKPQSLLAWQRVRVANLMSKSGEEWYSNFRRHPSGTYANQYMVVDFNRFEPYKPLKKGLLWIIEETPGVVHGGDLSETLSRGYWPSYNVPFWSDVSSQSGYTEVAEKHGNYFTYALNPRAAIFRRDQGKVRDLVGLKEMMRYNDYANDPYSKDSRGQPNPSWSICARGDLEPKQPKAGGCYDTKATSYQNGATLGHAWAVNGPTRGKGGSTLEAFSWKNEKWASKRHVGLPETYDFDFVDVQPAKLPAFGDRQVYM